MVEDRHGERLLMPSWRALTESIFECMLLMALLVGWHSHLH